MTDLLVNSLMAEGGLQTALKQAIYSRSQDDVTGTHLPLLHLIKQLLRNNSSLSQTRLNQVMLGSCIKHHNINRLSEPPSPSLDLLHKFQRLLFAFISQAKLDDLSGAESLLETYILEIVPHCIATLNKASEIMSQEKSTVLHVLKNDISDALLYELIVGLIVIHSSRFDFLQNFDWSIFTPLLKALDEFNKLTIDGDVLDSDDMGWPGVVNRCVNKTVPIFEDIPTIRQCDIENHILDGGNWIIFNGNVYDVKDYQCENPVTFDLLQNNSGKDMTAELSLPVHRPALEFITSFLRVGKLALDDANEKVTSIYIFI
jgi:E3 ubiquitin-protein ligase HERC2